MWDAFFIIVLVLFLVPIAYLMMLAIGATIKDRAVRNPVAAPKSKFIITIAAHNEEAVIEKSIRNLLQQDYPPQLFSVSVVADHCTDHTVSLARKAGATVYERNSGPRSGKSTALSWLFEQIWECEVNVDAIVIFDADTVVDRGFLQAMNTRLLNGEKVIQGQHIISNPQAGWFALLTWAMFIIDNRFQNQGRVNLGWSAKHMGDSICFRADVLQQTGCGSGLTEDYELRQKLLLNGTRIAYESSARGYGEAPKTWTRAHQQRSRWLRGTSDANKQYAAKLLRRGVKQRDAAMIDGAMQGYLPSFSTVTLGAITALTVIAAIKAFTTAVISLWVVKVWAVVALILFLYPFCGLALARAPLKAYLVILTGPVFILWRTWLAIKSRFIDKQVVWIRTQHGG